MISVFSVLPIYLKLINAGLRIWVYSTFCSQFVKEKEEQLHFRVSSKTLQLVIQPPDQTEPNLEKLLLIDPFNPSCNLSLDFMDNCIKVRASSNGMFCCSSVKNKHAYYVCNPITREYRVLPRTRDWPFNHTQLFYEATLVGL